MEEFAALQSFADLAHWLWAEALRWVMLFISPGWRQYQLFIIVGLIGAAFLLRLFVAPRVEAWARARTGWDKWQLRMLVQLRRMLGLICYAVLAWAVYLVMQQATWPSRSYLIGVAATLVTLWIVVAFVTRLVANAFLRRIVAWALWIYGTLYALNVSDDVADFLDGLTFGIGEVRLSVLTVLQAAVLIAVLMAIARLATTRASGALRRNEDISPSMQVLAVKAVQALVYGIVLMIAI
ncbi:MAG: mechanosensitive ion channel family protein, partial [Pseudomonadota bacterium]|nr:mechanosensitive ion channel family protein [Pseudomonadota bacterium]